MPIIVFQQLKIITRDDYFVPGGVVMKGKLNTNSSGSITCTGGSKNDSLLRPSSGMCLKPVRKAE